MTSEDVVVEDEVFEVEPSWREVDDSTEDVRFLLARIGIGGTSG